MGSSVFHAMFYGELAEDKDEVRIPDVEPASFLAMLKYVFKAINETKHFLHMFMYGVMKIAR